MVNKQNNLPTGMISVVQRYSTQDGPGIRSTVFFLGCNLACKWCSNPELISSEPSIMHFEERCIRCGRCVETAVDHSIRFEGKSVKIDRENCSNLWECMVACTQDAYEEIGVKISVSKLMDKLIRDKAYYDRSGGGVTFSGGDPILQGDFVIEVANRLRKNKIKSALDTAGNIAWEKLKPIIDAVDLVLYDIKAFDSQIHIDCTGVDNRLILENARQISKSGKDMIIRMVIVPGINDDLEDIRNRIKFILSLGPAVKQLDILPYHYLGVGKYGRLGLTYTINPTLNFDPEIKNEITSLVDGTSLRLTFSEF